MAAFERDGYVLMKAPLTEPELDEAEATFDRLLAQPGPEQPSWAVESSRRQLADFVWNITVEVH
jgi:hypothetical protein